MKEMKGGERSGKGLQKEGRNKQGSSVLSPLESQEMPDSWVSGFVFSGPLQSSDTKVAASEQTDHHSDVQHCKDSWGISGMGKCQCFLTQRLEPEIAQSLDGHCCEAVLQSWHWVSKGLFRVTPSIRSFESTKLSCVFSLDGQGIMFLFSLLSFFFFYQNWSALCFMAEI